MFRRKATTEIEGEKCPFCEFVNVTGATTCVQCYYDLTKAPRDQGDQVSAEVSGSLFDELMSDDDDDSYEETEALDVVLALDSDPLEINQYEATDFESEEPEKVGFIDSSSPELNETISHAPEDITADEIGEPIKDYQKLDFSSVDPLAEVPEPVHKGKGAVFSPNSPEMDVDLKGHIGGSELPSLPSEEIYENKIDFSAVNKAPAPTPQSVSLPEIPDLDFTTSSETQQEHKTQDASKLDIPEPVKVKEVPSLDADATAKAETTPPIVEQAPVVEQEVVATEQIMPETPAEVKPQEDNVEQPAPPIPINDGRFWPWPKGEPWDARQVHREVVTALEFTKAGKNDEASQTIDTLGPHLTDENVDLIYHIGMVLKQIGKTNEVKTMLEKANQSMPDNEHVNSATIHLGVS